MSDRPDPGPRQRHKRRYSQDELLLLKRLNGEMAATPPPAAEATLRQDPAMPLKRSAWSCYRVMRLLTRFVTWFYLLPFGLLLLGFHQWGQSNLTTAALMYIPQWVLIVPAVLLLLPVLIFDWKSLPFLLAASAFFVHSHLGFQIGPSKQDANGIKSLATVRVMTWNRGQGKGASLQAIKKDLYPDFVLLQDSVGKTSYYKTTAEYGEFSAVSGAGEFVMLSRWPILSTELLGIDRAENGAFSPGRAARFVVLAAGARCAIYSVHLQTPRGALESYKRGAFLYGLIGLPGTPWEEKKKSYQAFWDRQMRISREIADRIRAETIPVIVCGDFNTPTFGPIYDDYASTLQDAHLVAGSGCGYTFPGDTRNPLALFQPWLRLDQLFASDHWEIRRCQTIDVQAQHLPVVAEFHLLTEHRLVGGGDTSPPISAPPPEPQ